MISQNQKTLLNDVVKVLDKENDYFSDAVNHCKSASTIISTKPPKATFGIQPNILEGMFAKLAHRMSLASANNKVIWLFLLYNLDSKFSY